MTSAHIVLGIGVIALNLAAAAWGGARWFRQEPSVAFWYLLRVAQGAVVAQVLLGFALLSSGREPADDLHLLYGLLPLGVTLVAEGARAGVAVREAEGIDVAALPREDQRALALTIVRREMGIMAISAFVIFALALRAALTTGSI